MGRLQSLINEAQPVSHGLAGHPRGKNGAGALATAFYVDCRLYRTTDDAAKRSIRHLGIDVDDHEGLKPGDPVMALPGLMNKIDQPIPPQTLGTVRAFNKKGDMWVEFEGPQRRVPGAPAGDYFVRDIIARNDLKKCRHDPVVKAKMEAEAAKKQAALQAEVAQNQMKGAVASAAGGMPPELPPMDKVPVPVSYAPEADYAQQCSEIQGLFEDRVVTPKDTAEELAEDAPPGQVSQLSGSNFPAGIYIYNSRSLNWFHCVILGEKGRAYMNCAPWSSDEDAGSCGGVLDGSKCNYDRWNLTTACLAKSKSRMGAMGAVAGAISMGEHRCIYIGHFGEAAPLDLIGKPADYGVYFMSSPPPLLAASCPDVRPLRRSRQKCYSSFLAGPGTCQM